jgi:hypothetical protein
MRQVFVSLLLLSFLAIQTSAMTHDEKKSLSAEEIISKHLAAVGGKQALGRFQSRIAVGSVKKDNDTAVQMAIVSEFPDKVSAVYIFEKYDWQLTYDGKQAFLRPLFPRDLAPIQDKLLDMLASGVMFNSISLYNVLLDSQSYGAKFEAKGTKKIKDRLAYVVEMKRPKVAPARMYFDAETFMWIRTDYGKASISKPMGQFTNEVVPHGEDELSVDFYFETSDFRDVEGVKLPFKFEQVVTYPILHQKKVGTMTGTITEYRHNATIDPKMFR